MKFSVEGYKSIASKQELNFPGLTVLSGANSSGKSSFMQPFLILKQTVENHYDAGSLILYGENARLTDSSQIISKVPGFGKKSFQISVAGDDYSCALSYKYRKSVGLQVETVKLVNQEFPKGLILRQAMESEQIEKMVPPKSFAGIKALWEDKKLSPKWRAVRTKCFINAEFSADNKELLPIKVGIAPATELEHIIVRLIHVPGVRGNPARSYKIAASDDVYPGSFEKYVASIISDWARLGKYRNKYELLKKQLSELGLASDIRVSKVDDTSVELQVSRNKSNVESDCVNLADVGFGVSQTVPVLVALIVAKKDQFVYIEQPELHLHPKAQFEMASIITSAVNRGVRVVIETHSSILIRGFQLAVVKKQLEAAKVSLNWFSQDPETGETRVSVADLDEMGAFGDWPADFDEVSLAVEQKYLDAVEELIGE